MRNIFKIEEVKAHCDVPCGIYDPSTAQIAALSVIRMVDLMEALDKSDSLSYINTITRHVKVKEEEAEKVKHEIRIIWGDFIKPPQVEQFPEIHTIVHNIMMLGSTVRQHVSREKSIELLQEVNKFAEIFWQIKGVETKVVKAPYAPNEEVVIPVL